MNTLAYLYILAASVAVAVNSHAQTAMFVPQKLTFAELANPTTESSMSNLVQALTEVGLVSITDIPGLKDLRDRVLPSASECALGAKLDGVVSKTYELEDGSKRYTLGTKVVNGDYSHFEGADMMSASCKVFQSVERKFRKVVDSAMEAFMARLDDMQFGGSSKVHGRKLFFDEETQMHVVSFRELFESATQLEHFHTYETAQKESLRGLKRVKAEGLKIAMHKDQGLFIALLPAMSLSKDVNSDEHGFLIELQNGEIVKPEFGDNNELVFMIGDGFSQWLNPNLDTPLRATPHAVRMPAGSKEDVSLRSWYGRMVLPSDSMFLEAQGKTFGEMKLEFANTANSNADSLSSCSPGLAVSERLLQTCSEGEFFCWMQCYDIETIGCEEDEELVCGGYVDDELVECADGTHGSNCNPLCIA